MYFFTLKFSPMFLKVSAPLFLKATVPNLLVTVLLCEKVDIFTVRPSGPYLSILSVGIIVFWWLIISASQ